MMQIRVDGKAAMRDAATDISSKWLLLLLGFLHIMRKSNDTSYMSRSVECSPPSWAEASRSVDPMEVEGYRNEDWEKG